MGSKGQQPLKEFWQIIVGIGVILGIIVSVITIFQFVKAPQNTSSSGTSSGTQQTSITLTPTLSCTYCTPDKTLDTYCTADVNGDIQTQLAISDENFQKVLSSSSSGVPPTTCTHSSVNIDTNNTASASTTICYNFVNNASGSNTYTLFLNRDANGDWKIDHLTGGGNIQPIPNSRCNGT